MIDQPKILIVDDSKTNLALLEHMLGEEGCAIVSAPGGVEAVKLVREHDFALILLDIQMPGMDGYEAALRIKETDRGRHVPIIFITAIFQDDDNVRRGYETGAVDYLFRPVDVQALRSKVQVFLQMNRQKALLECEIEQRKRSQKALLQAEEKYRSIFERAVEGIFQSTLDGRFREVNPAMVRLFGYGSAEEMIALGKMRELIMANEEERERYLRNLHRDGQVSSFEYQARKKDGEIIWVSESSRIFRDIGDGVDVVEGLLEDVTRRKEAELNLKRLANVDSLTGVANRHRFFDRLEHSLASAKRCHALVAVLFIDLNEFKRVNDTHGHPVGDELLRQVAMRLDDRVRESDTLARLGGDEFGVLIEHIDKEEAALCVAHSLQEVMDTPFEVKGKKLLIGATVGVSFYPADGKDGVTLVSRADAAMYGVKRKSGFRVGTFKEFGQPK